MRRPWTRGTFRISMPHEESSTYRLSRPYWLATHVVPRCLQNGRCSLGLLYCRAGPSRKCNVKAQRVKVLCVLGIHRTHVSAIFYQPARSMVTTRRALSLSLQRARPERHTRSVRLRTAIGVRGRAVRHGHAPVTTRQSAVRSRARRESPLQYRWRVSQCQGRLVTV